MELKFERPQKPKEQDFQDKFEQWNIEKFGGKLPHYKVGFRKMRSLGRVSFKGKYISINPAPHIDSMFNTLLHEMIHAELHRRGCRNTSHSVRFWRMFVEKGGEITATNKQLFAKARQVAGEKNA